MIPGDTVIFEPVGTRGYVGVVVSTDPAYTVFREVVQVHDFGIWERFTDGDLDGANERKNLGLSACPADAEMRVPTHMILSLPWPGDLAELRRRGGARDE